MDFLVMRVFVKIWWIFPFVFVFSLLFAIRETVKDGPNDLKYALAAAVSCLFWLQFVCRIIVTTKQGLGQARPNKSTSETRQSLRSEVPDGQKFSRIENLWPRDDSCLLCFPSTFLPAMFSIDILENFPQFRYLS